MSVCLPRGLTEFQMSRQTHRRDKSAASRKTAVTRVQPVAKPLTFKRIANSTLPCFRMWTSLMMSIFSSMSYCAEACEGGREGAKA